MTDTYTAYELEDGEAMEDVESYCAHLTNGGSFDDTTQPKRHDVERWLTLSHHWLAGLLASNGVAVDQTDPEVLGVLQELNVLDVVVKCELANPLTGPGEPNDRFKEFSARRDVLVTMIDETNALTALGAEKRFAGSLSQLLAISGISLSRKRSVEYDADYVQPRFKKGQGRNTDYANRSTGEADYYRTDN